MNPYQGWLHIIGTKQRAAKLRKLLTRIPEAKIETQLITDREGMPVMFLRQRTPAMCPAKLLFGDKESQKFYLNASLRPALDAWDTGEISIKELKAICFQIEGIRPERKNAKK